MEADGAAGPQVRVPKSRSVEVEGSNSEARTGSGADKARSNGAAAAELRGRQEGLCDGIVVEVAEKLAHLDR